MAEALLRDRLAARGIDARVHSAGELDGGVPASGGSVRAMAARGLDLRAHRSQPTTRQMVADADLVVCMARRHLQNAVVMVRDAFPRTYTLKELVRRAEERPRRRDEDMREWLERLHVGRTASGLLGDHADDDISDPIGGPDRLYEATAKEIEALVDRFISLAFDKIDNHSRETA